MKEQKPFSRRMLLKSSAFGLLTVTIPNAVYSKDISHPGIASVSSLHERFPAIELSVASEVVGVSHFNLDRLKQLVDPRPELSRAIWDWGFGDWESAIDAASHVGRKDIVDYLLGKGAVPTLFTYAMLGSFDIVRSMIMAQPGIQKNTGPHGLSLLHHAKLALDIDGIDKANAQKLIDYLQSLGDADGKQYLPLEDSEKEKYLGDYKYGDGKDDGFTIKLNMRKLPALGKLGKSGGTLLRTGEHTFTYQGAPSVTVTFDVRDNKVFSLSLREPGLKLTAKKV